MATGTGAGSIVQGSVGQIGRNCIGCACEIGQVGAVAAIQCVDTAQCCQRIIAVTAGQRVRTCCAGQGISLSRANG